MRALLLALVALLFSAPLMAGDADVSWDHPTQYVDGTPLPGASIARTELEYGKCNATRTALLATPAPVIVQVTYPTATRLITGLGAGEWCVRARTVATSATDNTSDWTAFAWKAITMKLGPPVSIRVQ